MSFDFKVSNQIWRYDTDLGSFIVKWMQAPDALYGHQDAASRLELVGQVVAALRQAGLPVEEILPRADGAFIARDEGGLTRVFRLEQTGPADAALAVRSLRELHRNGLAATPAALRAQLEGHTTFYPLATIAHELPAVRQFAERENLSDILADWELVEWAVASSIAYRHRSQPRKAIVHTDAHPNNVLFSNGRAILIDCDNVVIDYPFQCLGFTILRFYLSAADRSSRRLAAATQAHGDGDPAFIADLVHGMLSLETAKSVRILFRVMRTGTYANFVDNVSRLHIANLNAIAPLFRDYCCDA